MLNSNVRVLGGRPIFRVGQPLVVLEAHPNDRGTITVRIGIVILGQRPEYRTDHFAYAGDPNSEADVATAVALVVPYVDSLIQVEYIDRNPEPDGNLPPAQLKEVDHTVLRSAWMRDDCRNVVGRLFDNFVDRSLKEYAKFLRDAVPQAPSEW